MNLPPGTLLLRIGLFGLVLMSSSWIGVLPSRAQGGGSLGAAISDPLSQEVLRALQQRGGGGQTIDPNVQPSVQVQTQPVYPQSPSAVSRDILENPAMATTGLSALERLMSLRAGQRLLQFGYETFGHASPVVMRQSGALQDNYVLGEGDEIVVTLHGQENANYRTRVDRDGRVVLPNLPAIAAAGRDFGAFRADLERAVSRAFVGTEVSVSVGSVRQIAVQVVGEVNAPGAYNLTGLSTALDALNLSGGVKKTGSLRNIQIVRGERILHLDLYRLLADQNPGSDITLTEGDRIVVPLLTGAVAVAGQVRRPGIYELPPGAAGARTDDLLALAGGPQLRGAYRFSVMKTGDDGRRQMQPVTPGSNLQVRDGDALFVASAANASVARVELMGSTASHGTFALGDASTLQALLKSPDMFAPQPGEPLPYLLMGAIVRLDRETMQRAVVAFSPVDIMNGKTDLALQSNDVVYILNVAEMRYIARGAAEAATREAEHSGGGTPNPTSRDQTALNRLDTNGQTVSPETLQTGSLNGAGLGALGTASLIAPSSVRGDGTQDLRARQLTDNSMLPEINRQQRVTGPYGMDDNDDLPELGGIPAPRDLMSDDDRDLNPARDNGDQRSGDEKTTMRGDSDRRPDHRNDQRRKPTLRLFVGLDDDERQLLVRTLSSYYVMLSGEVNNPGAFLAMPQVGLDKIVQAAGGVTPNIDLSGFEVSSAEVDNGSGVSRTLRKTYKLPVAQFSQVALKPLDSVRFNKVFSDSAGEMTVYGEVRYPGSYAITRSERLSSVLARAGGLTDAAYPYGAIFLRRSVAEEERGVLQREADALDSQLVGLMGTVSATKGQVTDAEIQYISQMMVRLRQANGQGGRVAVQIDPHEIAAHPELDIVMEPGDQLFVPRAPNSVIVAGEVMSPSGIQFKPGDSVNDYLALAGGPTEIADEDHIFVIQPDGSAMQADGTSWLGDPPKLAPGSVIVVPRTLHPFSWDVVLQNVIQMTSQLAITAASISVIGK